MDDLSVFTAIDENGDESKYKMLYCKVVGDKPIIWYTDGIRSENGQYSIYISSYQEKDNKFLLDSIDNDLEMKKYITIFKQDNNL